MGSPLSNAVIEASKKATENVAHEISKNLDSALDEVRKQVINKLQAVIEQDMLARYYAGYEPIQYKRTYQLQNSVSPLIKNFSSGTEKGFDFGITWEPNAMNHHGGITEHTIDMYFSSGFHPTHSKYGVNQGPIWIMGNQSNIGSAADIVRDWASENIEKIFSQALSSIMK